MNRICPLNITFQLASLGFEGIKSYLFVLDSGRNFRLLLRLKVHVLRALETNGSLFASPSLTWSLLSIHKKF